jgi:PAS domain S-box-containing protein
MTGGSHSGAPTDLDPRLHDWRALIERLPLAVYIDRLDEWSSSLYTSPQIEPILGYSPGEWTSDDHLLLRILHPEDRDRVMAAHRRSCEIGEPFRMEYRMIARDERVLWFLDHATVVPGRSGQAGFHHGFLLDITERKALEAELAEGTEQLERQKGYFESLLEISPVAIVTTDADDVVSSWNPAAERLFGHARREALGRTIDDLSGAARRGGHGQPRRPRRRPCPRRHETHAQGRLTDRRRAARRAGAGGG